MLRKLRRAGKRTPKQIQDGGVRRDETALHATLPSPFGGDPLLQLNVRVHSEQHGERSVVKLHATVDSVVQPAKLVAKHRQLAAPAPTSGERALQTLPKRVASRAADRLAALPVVQRLAGRLHGEWMLTASTHDVPNTEALVPGAMAKLGFGHASLLRSSEPVVEVSETVGDDGTHNQIGLLRLRKEHLPPALAEALGQLPFNLSAAWLTQVQKH